MATNTASRDPNRNVTIQGVDSISFTDPTNIAVNASSHAVLVEISGGATDQDVNLVSISGSAITLGQKTAANSLPVIFASDQSAISVNATLTAETTKVIGTVNQGTSPWIINSNAAFATTAPANGYAVGFKDGIGQMAMMRGAGVGDGAGSDSLLANQGFLFNGSGNDRLRSIITGTDSIGTGITATGLVAQFDDTSPSTVTENQFGNVRLNSARQLYAQTVNIDTFASVGTLTITLASLASSAAGVGRQSTLVTSNKARSAMIGVKFTVGTTPTANSLVYVYLIRTSGTLNDDGAGSSDAGLTVVNAPLLGTILVPAATSNTAYYGIFDTKFLGSLGSSWGIAVVNSSGATANGTGGNFTAEYTLIT